jgi:hypothetical protein
MPAPETMRYVREIRELLATDPHARLVINGKAVDIRTLDAAYAEDVVSLEGIERPSPCTPGASNAPCLVVRISRCGKRIDSDAVRLTVTATAPCAWAKPSAAAF